MALGTRRRGRRAAARPEDERREFRAALCQDPADPASKIGREALEARERLRAKTGGAAEQSSRKSGPFAYPYVRESLRLYKSGGEGVQRHEGLLFPPPPPPPPFLPLTDVCARTNVCLFVRVEKGESLLAMDAGGVSDPFATARWGALECTTEIKYETVDPVWDETFVFELGSIGEVVDEDLTLCLYDYDLALNDFLGFVRVDLRGKKVADAKDWSREGKWYSVEALPESTARASRAAPGSTGGGSSDQLMFWEGKREYTGASRSPRGWARATTKRCAWRLARNRGAPRNGVARTPRSTSSR